MIDNFGSDPFRLANHVPEAEKWAKFVLGKYPKADKDVVLLAVWLHDIGHYPIPKIDHAIISEKIAEEFLIHENYDKEKSKKVLHSVRAHRCLDAMPQTLEAKIMAFSDSASHITDSVYINIARDDIKKREKYNLIYSKMERDYRDLSLFPEIQKKLKPLSIAWKNLIKEYEKNDLG